MKFFEFSIRARLLLWFGFLLAAVLAGFGMTALQLYRNDQFRQVDEGLHRRVTAVAGDIRRMRPSFDERFRRGGPGGPVGPDGRRAGEDPRRLPDDGRKKSPPPGTPPTPPSGEEVAGPVAPTTGAETPGPRRSPGDFGLRPWPWPPMMPGSRGGLSGAEPETLKLSAATANLFDQNDATGHYFATWTREGTKLLYSNNAPAGLERPGGFEGTGRMIERLRAGYREAYYFTERGHGVLVGVAVTGVEEAGRRFAWLLVAVGAAVLAVGLGGAWGIATRALQPVKEIGATAQRIADGNLAERIPVSDAASELGQLAAVLNSTFARLEAAFAEQKNFTADASHELRTPLAVLITMAQTVLARERTPAEYREAMQSCLKTSQQMRRLTDSLLMLARYDAGQEAIQFEAIDLAEVARGSAELLQPIAAAKKITVHFALDAAPATGDAQRLGQVVTNLVANALHYNHEGGEVRIATAAADGGVRLTVADRGPGIAADDLPHVFERFYRADKARTRSEGRSGLGLAICKAIVDAHRGRIEVASKPGEGAEFSVWLPGRA